MLFKYMKKTDLPFNNSGGLKQILAIPESSFRGVGFNQDCTRYLNLSNQDEIICICCLPFDGGYQENRQESDSGDIYQVEISGFIYGKSANNDQIISALDAGTWIVATEDADGNWIVFGSNRVRLVFERKKDTSTSRSGLKGTSFSFSCEDEYESINIQNPMN